MGSISNPNISSFASIVKSYDNYVFKFCRSTLAQGVETIVWSGVGQYNGHIDSAQALEVSSTSIQDTNVTGTGAWTLLVTGLDENGYQIVKEVPLDGTNWVDVPGLFRRVYTMRIDLAGNKDIPSNSASKGPNIGTITVRVKSATTIIMGIINPFIGRTLMGVYTCPINKYGEVNFFNFSANEGKGAILPIYARENMGAGNKAWNVEGTVDLYQSAMDVNLTHNPLIIGPLTDIVISGLSSAAGTVVSCIFTIRLFDLNVSSNV